MCKNSEPWVFTLPEDFSWDCEGAERPLRLL